MGAGGHEPGQMAARERDGSLHREPEGSGEERSGVVIPVEDEMGEA